MKSIFLKTAVTAVLMGMTAVAFAAPGGGKGPPDGKGNKPDTEAGNNLSVPMMMIDSQFALVCGGDGSWSDMTYVVADDPLFVAYDCGPLPDDQQYCVPEGFYFVQGTHNWQAQCVELGSADLPVDVYGAWGDNLAGDAKFKVGSPIRVELVLENQSVETPKEGYTVIKLEPNELDRASAYGTLATQDDEGTYAATVTMFNPLVHDGKATFSVQHIDSGAYAVEPGTNPTAEINATGKIVYGYNLRVGEPGDYYIEFKVPSVNFLACNHAIDEDEICGGDTTKIRIHVLAGGGGGGKRE